MALFYNLAGLLVAVISIVVAMIFNFYVGGSVYLIACSVTWLIFFLFNIITKPSKSSTFCLSLRPMELEAFLRFHLYISSPMIANFMSGVLNSLRMIAIFWGVAFLYYALYGHAIFVLLLYCISGSFCARTAPNLYFVDGAHKGNLVAQEQLHLLERVMHKYSLHNQA